MKLRSLKIGIYKGFKRVNTTYMITGLSESDAIEYCKDVFIGRRCKVEKQ